MEELYDLKMSNIKNDVSELNDAEGSDNSKYMNTRIFCKIAMMLININNRLTELNQILGHKSGIDQPDGWDSSNPVSTSPYTASLERNKTLHPFPNAVSINSPVDSTLTANALSN